MKYYKAHSQPGRLSDILGPWHREYGVIPGMAPAQDVYSFAADPDRSSDRLYMTIKNPSKAYRNAYSQ